MGAPAADMPARSAHASQPLPSIQILRALAALSVMTVHTALPGHVTGGAGVDLFFVISGFIMVYASEPLFGRRDAPRIFFLRRVVRIVPLYWAATATLVGILLHLRGDLVGMRGMIIASFAFFPYPAPDGRMVPLHVLGWTLNYEMFFYAVFAGAMVLSRRRTVLAIVILFAAAVALGLAFKLPQPFAFWSDPIILEFCFGMLLALAYREGVQLPYAASVGLMLAGALGFVASAFFDDSMAWRTIAWGVPATAVLAGSVLSKESPTPAPLARTFVFLGDASYSLYLVHYVVLALLPQSRLRWFEAAPEWSYGLFLMAASIAIAVMVYLLFENPTRRWLQARLRIDRRRPGVQDVRGEQHDVYRPVPAVQPLGEPR